MFSPRNGARTTTALREIEIDLGGIFADHVASPRAERPVQTVSEFLMTKDVHGRARRVLNCCKATVSAIVCFVQCGDRCGCR
jgi:hypothetical protein